MRGQRMATMPVAAGTHSARRAFCREPGDVFMKLFSCDHCGNTIYFENAVCERCGHALGYVPESNALVSLEPAESGFVSPALGKHYRYCANAMEGACNWLRPASSGESFCAACRHNETIPPLGDPTNLNHWQT